MVPKKKKKLPSSLSNPPSHPNPPPHVRKEKKAHLYTKELTWRVPC